MGKNITKTGFSLIEVMIALLIMATSALFLATSVPHEFFISQNTQDLAKATDLAQKYIEEVKYQLKTTSTYESVSIGTAPPIPISSDITGNGYFNVSTNVDFVGRTDRENTLKEITVYFKKAGQNNNLATFSTIIIKPDDAL